MVKRGPKPGATQISASVMKGLATNSNLTPASLAFITFSPTLGIAAKRIDKLGMDIRSFKEPLTRAVREVMTESIWQNFEQHGRPAWEPLSEGTMQARANFGWSGGGVLILSGALRTTASQINIWTITSTSATIRDLPQKVWYGKIHQAGYEGSAPFRGGNDPAQALKDLVARARKGGSKGKVVNSIPARPFLMIHPEDEQDIQDIFMEWLEERVNRAWPG